MEVNLTNYLGMKIMSFRLEIVSHNLHWKEEFNNEAQQVQKALKNIIVAIHHIGSTAIPNIYAKPIIDLLIEVKDIQKVDLHNTSMEALGYETMGEFGIPNRRYFRKHNQERKRTHHVHIFEVNSREVTRHLAFRDYLMAYPEKAQTYSKLKQELVKHLSPDDIEGYMDGKDPFIKTIEKEALNWYQSQEKSL